jgi:hypothetical protein
LLHRPAEPYVESFMRAHRLAAHAAQI